MANKRNSELHKGHRQRLKARAEKFGLKSFSEHEAMELFLSYTIPRVDINELAHNLNNTFGGFYGCLNAEKEDLLKINGIGKESALYIILMKQIKIISVPETEPIMWVVPL